MAHFAELDENNSEEIGVKYCQNVFQGNWKRTSRDAEFRKRYAGEGDVYDPTLDAFVPPKPFPSWILNAETANCEAPTPMPRDGKIYDCEEPSITWVEVVPV